MTDTTPAARTATIAGLTLEEKASLTSGASFWYTKPIERAGIPAIMVTDGPHGLRKQREGGDHLGLGDSVPATCFPPAVALGSSWDVDLVHRVGEALGTETSDRERRGAARARHQHQALAPVRPQLRVPLRGPDRLG